ncbi:MAG: hypothetical protein HXY23_00170 [Parvularculaceae bacterium]|nr:hypothetical protein [Parvularculaceae bacterium]
MQSYLLASIVLLASLVSTGPAVAGAVYGVEISPDGRHYAVLQDAGDQRAFAVYSVDDVSAKPVGIGVGSIGIEDFEWGGNDRLLLKVAGEKGGVRTNKGLKTLSVARWLSISSTTGESKTLFGNERGVDYYYYLPDAGFLLSALPADNENALFARGYVAVKPSGPTRLKEGEDEFLLAVQRVDLSSGASKLIADADRNTADWVADADGAVVARIDQNAKSKEIRILAAPPGGGGLKEVGVIPGEVVEREKTVIFGLAGADAPRELTLLVERDGVRRLALFNLDTGAISDGPQTPGPVTRAVYDPREARARLVYYRTDRERAFHLDEADRKTQAALEKAVPGAAIAIVSKSLDGGRMIARADYADKPEEYFLYDKAAKRLELVASN